MSDELNFLQRRVSLGELKANATRDRPPVQNEEAEGSCAAFGYLRGVGDRALLLEVRFPDGTSDFYSYSLLQAFRYNPSRGVLLKFVGDVVTLVLIHGANLDAPMGEPAVSLTHRGLQRHRITFVRAMSEGELSRAGRHEPTIDRIEVAEFQTHQESLEWLKTHAPVFARREGWA